MYQRQMLYNQSKLKKSRQQRQNTTDRLYGMQSTHTKQEKGFYTNNVASEQREAYKIMLKDRLKSYWPVLKEMYPHFDNKQWYSVFGRKYEKSLNFCPFTISSIPQLENAVRIAEELLNPVYN